MSTFQNQIAMMFDKHISHRSGVVHVCARYSLSSDSDCLVSFSPYFFPMVILHNFFLILLNYGGLRFGVLVLFSVFGVGSFS